MFLPRSIEPGRRTLCRFRGFIDSCLGHLRRVVAFDCIKNPVQPKGDGCHAQKHYMPAAKLCGAVRAGVIRKTYSRGTSAICRDGSQVIQADNDQDRHCVLHWLGAVWPRPQSPLYKVLWRGCLRRFIPPVLGVAPDKFRVGLTLKSVNVFAHCQNDSKFVVLKT